MLQQRIKTALEDMLGAVQTSMQPRYMLASKLKALSPVCRLPVLILQFEFAVQFDVLKTYRFVHRCLLLGRGCHPVGKLQTASH
jgi:hypothetical protein